MRASPQRPPPSLKHPRRVYQLLKKHYARHIVKNVCNTSDADKDAFAPSPLLPPPPASPCGPGAFVRHPPQARATLQPILA